jgi:hypothetical protein
MHQENKYPAFYDMHVEKLTVQQSQILITVLRSEIARLKRWQPWALLGVCGLVMIPLLVLLVLK